MMGMVSDFLLGSYVMCSKPKTKSGTPTCAVPQFTEKPLCLDNLGVGPVRTTGLRAIAPAGPLSSIDPAILGRFSKNGHMARGSRGRVFDNDKKGAEGPPGSRCPLFALPTEVGTSDGTKASRCLHRMGRSGLRLHRVAREVVFDLAPRSRRRQASPLGLPPFRTPAQVRPKVRDDERIAGQSQLCPATP